MIQFSALTKILLAAMVFGSLGIAHAQWDTDWTRADVSTSNSFDYEEQDFDQAYGSGSHTMGVDQYGSTLSNFEQALGWNSNTMGSAPIGKGGVSDSSLYGQSQVQDSCSMYDDWADFMGGVQHRQGLDAPWGETDPRAVSTGNIGRTLPMCGFLESVTIINDKRITNSMYYNNDRTYNNNDN